MHIRWLYEVARARLWRKPDYMGVTIFVSAFFWIQNQRQIQPGRTGRAPPCLKYFFFENFDRRTRINFIVINMQCLQRVFYSHLSLQKHRVCVKGHQNNLQTSKSILRLDRAPGSKIPGSAFEYTKNKTTKIK